MKKQFTSTAKIVIEYQDEKTAQTIAKAISPDNIATDLISIENYTEKNKLVITVQCKKSVGSLLATLDDILFSIQTAEKTLKEV